MSAESATTVSALRESSCLAVVLVLALVLKDSLRTYFKSLSLSWSLGVRSLSLWIRSLIVLVLFLVVQSLSLFLVLARTCFHYSIIPIYSHNIIIGPIVVSMHTISFNYTKDNRVLDLIILTYVFLPLSCFASINMMYKIMVLPRSSNIIGSYVGLPS